MKMVKSLILGSAAALVAISGAQAADLPLKAKAVEYVKVCSLYGAGFYYIPGTDTCIKLGGYLRADLTLNGSAGFDAPAWNGNSGQQNRLKNDFIFRSRQDINIDTRTATEYGVVRTYFDAIFQWTTGTDTIAGGSLGVYYAFVQFAGFTFGKAVSQFDAPWSGYPGNNTSYLLGGYDDVTGINQISYTAQFGNGVSAAISLEDPYAYLQSALYNTSFAASGTTGFAGGVAGAATFYGANSYAGTQIPDIVGQLRVDQAWGLFQLSAAAHQIRASYYNPGDETTGHPGDKWGYAVQAALSIKNIPTGPGDSINVSAGYADGASRYLIGGVTGNSFAMFGGTGAPGAYQSLAFAASSDGVFAGTSSANGTGIQTTTGWALRGAFNHNWSPYWSSSLFGSYTAINYNGTATALICGGTGFGLLNITGYTPVAGSGYSCNPDFNIAQVGLVTRWTPVRNLTLSGEVLYTNLDQNFSGVVALPAVGTKPARSYELKDQDTWTGNLRIQRNF
ncbi:porin [Rhodopseudomonas palustris]|uniref:Porin n=1 Tax=Rhodopseudomonas palustris (strain BisB18) TaxID=316056 RepID=Q213J7_RHOPB